MAGYLRKLLGYQQTPQRTDEDTDLEQFYTNAEYARQVFEQLATAPNLSKRLLVIHGIGGVGKSTLLKMYALFCHKHHISVALVASEEAPSPVDVLADWTGDLSHDGNALPAFQKTLTHYRAIQAKVEDESRKQHQAKSEIAGTMGRAAAKTAINMAASAIPIVGPLVGTVGGESAEAFIDWLHSFLTKPDMDLYLDPAKRLDDDFLSDLTRVAVRQRIVLMTDTYEQMTTLDVWMRELARRLPKNVLLVIAGRTIPEWNRAWQGWMGKAEILELEEMTPHDLRTLVHRYYTYIRSGEPDPKQVEEIVQFARGLPMVATTVVQLWVKHGAEDFQTVRPQVVADLADRLLEGVPQETRPAFEAAAALRYFNVDALGAILEGGNPEALYVELRRWPFIRSRKEGLAVHDTMREMMNEALRMRTSERFRTLHERAAAYYETQMSKAIGEERERYLSEWLYHRVCIDESDGMHLFQEQAEEFTRYRMVNQLRTLLNDVNTYSLERENSRLWRAYYNARLAHVREQYSAAEKVYQGIGENEHIDPKLRAYALCDWGEILCLRERLYKPGGIEKAFDVLKSSLQAGAEIDVKLEMNWLYLSDVYAAKSNWEQALISLEQPKKFFTECGDYSSLLVVHFYERAVYRRQGNFRNMLHVEDKMTEIYTAAGKPPYLRYLVSFSWEWILLGRCAEAEEDLHSALQEVRLLEEKKFITKKSGDLAISLCFQDKCAKALDAAMEALDYAHNLGSGDQLEVFLTLTVCGITCLKCGKFERAEEYLTKAITFGRQIHAYLVAPSVYLAIVYEVLGNFDKAEHFYQLLQAETREFVQYYFLCGGNTGLGRVKYAQHDYGALPPLFTEAERLAQQYEYNDHLTSLYLTRGHITWDGLIPQWESGFESALHNYQLALLHAMRYNRFLLDEALWGREQGTPLRPIIPYCQGRGEQGQRMLVALRDWWQSGINDNGRPRPETISPIPEGIALLEAERIARKRELGDGSPQKNVVEQINAALTMANGGERSSR
jgi:tetratricopeptide (TPR) repeat protein